jgi:hypothetical protein
VKLDKLLDSFVNRHEHTNRKLGRYWATDVYRIKKGYLTVEDFFEVKQINLDGIRMILTGRAMEDMLTQIFEKQEVDTLPQEKKVLSIDKDVDLVVKPDYVFPDFVLETKFPFSVVNPYQIPERYKDQLECEYRAFEREVYLGIFSIPFNVTFIPYTPTKRRWNSIQKALKEFHNELKEYVKQNEERITR